MTYETRAGRTDITKLKARYGELFDKISDALFRADLSGINFEFNTDEYDAEAATILARLTEESSVEDIQTIAHEEFCWWFGKKDAGTRDRYHAIAVEISTLWGDFLRAGR